MANFTIAVTLILSHEGGYQDNVNDKGNYYNDKLIGTNYGISAPKLAEWYGDDITAADSKNLSKAKAKEIYKKDYWDRLHADQIKSQALANILFDASVVQGRSRSIRWMQETINETFGENLKEDGISGSNTINAINRVVEWELHNAFKARRKAEFISTAKKKGQSGFSGGWANRLNTFEDMSPDQGLTYEGGMLDEITVTASVGWDKATGGVADFISENTPLKKGYLNVRLVVKVIVVLLLMIMTYRMFFMPKLSIVHNK